MQGPMYGRRWQTGFISDDVLRRTGTSTDSPLGKPTSGSVSTHHLGNKLNATAPTDSRVKHYAVYRGTTNVLADAVFYENTDGLPWTDRQSSANDLIGTTHYYWLVSLDRNYAHYQTAALDAFYMGSN